jgi:7-cyano-7-deazaguanine synthase
MKKKLRLRLIPSEKGRVGACPDTSPEFTEMMALALSVGTKRFKENGEKLRVLAPLNYMEKHQVVKLAKELGVPIELTRSCYANTEEVCGICGACVQRENGFFEARERDPAAPKSV